MTTRVRYPGPPPIISLKCYLVAFAVWGRRVLVRIQVGRPVFALVSLVVEVLFCNQGVEVRFLPGAPSSDVIVGTSGQKYLPMTCFEHEGWFDSNSIHQVLRWIDIASWI